MRDARVLRTLALLDLESNPPPAAIDRVAVGVDVTEGRVLQFGLFARALPTDTLATLLARLGALMGSDRVGAPSLVDTYRPGAFAMATFDPPRTFTNPQAPIPNPQSLIDQRRQRRVAALSKSHPRARRRRAGAACPRHDRSPRICRRPRRALRRSVAIVGRLVEDDVMELRRMGVALSDGATYRISQAHDDWRWSSMAWWTTNELKMGLRIGRLLLD